MCLLGQNAEKNKNKNKKSKSCTATFPLRTPSSRLPSHILRLDVTTFPIRNILCLNDTHCKLLSRFLFLVDLSSRLYPSPMLLKLTFERVLIRDICAYHGCRPWGLLVSDSHWLFRRGRALTTCSRINVNDPSLIALVNKLQDVFTTVGVSIIHLGMQVMPLVTCCPCRSKIR